MKSHICIFIRSLLLNRLFELEEPICLTVIFKFQFCCRLYKGLYTSRDDYCVLLVTLFPSVYDQVVSLQVIAVGIIYI